MLGFTNKSYVSIHKIFNFFFFLSDNYNNNYVLVETNVWDTT